MAYTLPPWQVFLTALAGWINRHQQAAIDFLREGNRVLRHQLGDRRIRLTDDRRRRPAVAGMAVGRTALLDLTGLVTRDTILAWDGKLVAAKWEQRSKRGPCRPDVMKEIEKLNDRVGTENPSCLRNRRRQGGTRTRALRIAVEFPQRYEEAHVEMPAAGHHSPPAEIR